MSDALAICRRTESGPLEQLPWEPPAGADPLLEVVAASLGAYDMAPPPSWPRIGGGVLAARDPGGTLWLCGGYLPCNRCARCQSGLLLACDHPSRPGWNMPGGLASSLRLPAGSAPAEFAAGKLPQVVGVLGAAGLTYQAQASAGMVPGDAVVVVGDAGPGAIPIRLLAAGGLRPVHAGPGAAMPVPSDLPSSRCHVIDLQPTATSLARWLPLAASCLSISLLGPPRPALVADLSAVLAGQACARWIADLHPHLVLDIAALIASGRLCVDDALQLVPRAEAPPALDAFFAGQAQRWPVVVTTCSR